MNLVVMLKHIALPYIEMDSVAAVSTNALHAFGSAPHPSLPEAKVFTIASLKWVIFVSSESLQDVKNDSVTVSLVAAAESR